MRTHRRDRAHYQAAFSDGKRNAFSDPTNTKKSQSSYEVNGERTQFMILYKFIIGSCYSNSSSV